MLTVYSQSRGIRPERTCRDRITKKDPNTLFPQGLMTMESTVSRGYQYKVLTPDYLTHPVL